MMSGGRHRRRGTPDVGQVDGGDMGRKLKSRTALAVARPVHRSVNRQNQRLVAGAFRPLHELAHKAAVMLHIELEPQWAMPGRGQHDAGYCVQRHARLHAEHHAGTQSRCGMRRCQLTVGMRHALVRNRCQQNGMGQRTAEQLLAGVACTQVAQYTGKQVDVVPVGAIAANRDFIASATVEIGLRMGVHPCLRMPGMVGQRHNAGGEFFHGGAAGDAPVVSGR